MTREEAIKIVKEFINGTCLHLVDQEALETLIPELANSEDERIKKIITDSVFYQYGAGVEYKDVLDYLDKIEKQKEQKVDIDKEKLIRHCIGLILTDATDERFKDYGLTLKECLTWLGEQKEQKPWKVGANAYFTPEQKPAESISQLTVQGKGVYKICPRCKERMVRDDSKVYTSMPPQYGYECPKCGEMEFDTVMYDNPEMEEQKPAEKHDLLAQLREHLANTPKEQLEAEWKELEKWNHVGPTVEEYLGSIKTAEWSDTDNIGWDEAFACATRAEKSAKNEEELQNAVIAEKWLKEIKFKYCVHPVKQEWSVEDEDRIRQIERIAQQAGCTQKLQEEIHDWLKSLRPSWKPSEEQMEALKDAVKLYKETHFERFHDRIVSLYEQLKKL